MTDTLVSLARFVSGKDLDGQDRTDARWAHPGTQAYTRSGRAGRWAYYSHRRRAGVRFLVLLAAGLVAYGAITNLLSTTATLRVAVWLLIAIGVWAVVEKSRRYAHRREVVAPLAEALAEKIGDSRYVLDPRTWLAVPVDTHDRPTRVYLPRGKTFTDAQEKQLVKLVATRLGLVAPSHTFDMRGEWPFMEVRPAPAPREFVRFTDPDVRAAVDAAPEGRPFLGMGPRDQVIDVDLDAESPHVGVSVATGGGKSVLARGLAAQVLHHGGIALVLDRKIESQLWAAGLDSVRYACSEQEIFDALMAASGEIDRRFELVRTRRFAGEPLDRAEIGPRLLIVCEELNALEIDLRIWWRTVREPGDPAQCPALPVLGRILAMGRAGRVHMVVIAQKLTCQAIGGTAARENLSTRILGRATASTWNMLAPECKVAGKFPRSSRVRGRVHVVVGDEATPTQVMFLGEDEAREHATSGELAVFPTGAGAAQHPVSPAMTSEAAGVPHLALVPDAEADERDDVTLAQAAERLGLTVKTVRNGRDRDPDFPDPVSAAPGRPSLYPYADIESWAAGRAVGVGGGAS